MNNELSKNVPSFLSYLQKRMDFIAQVATSAPSWCMVTNGDEMIDQFNNQYCLVRNIIRSHQGLKNGPNFEPLFEKKYDNQKDGAPDLDIPHGQVGVQAFYTILENLVRNTAKYGDTTQLEEIKSNKGDGKLRFTISISDRWDDGGCGWDQDFYQVKIIDPLKTEELPNVKESVVDTLNDFLKEPLTDPATGVANPKHWGMKEIKICAAYLRMVKQDQIDMKFELWDKGQSKKPPIIKVSLEKVERNQGRIKGHLTYTLYLLRPKRALVAMTPPPLDVQENFRRAGIDFIAIDKFKEEINQGASPRHSYLVLPKPKDQDEWIWLYDNQSFLPPRVLIMDATEEDIPPGRGQLNRALAFMSAPPLRSPALFMDYLSAHWVGRWWQDFEIFVRWFKHPSTIADRGAIESEDTWTDEEVKAQSRWLVFDHAPNPDESRLFRAAAYHEPLDSDSPTAKLLERRTGILTDLEEITSEMLERQSRYRIKEAAALSVAIIDERAWLERDGLALRGIKKYSGAGAKTRLQVWAKRRVYLLDTNHALNNFTEFVNSLKPPDRGIFDFIIIHQGIIDGVRDKSKRESDKEKGKRELDAAWKALKTKARWLVVDSGRGQPEQARDDKLRWVEYSNLAECLIHEAGDKFRLAELLWTLRASSRNGVLS